MRTTKDIDLAGTEEGSLKAFESVIRSCIESTDVEEDGLSFDPESIQGEHIRESQSYGGIRVTFMAYLGSAKINMQIDIGFGDAITPGPYLSKFRRFWMRNTSRLKPIHWKVLYPKRSRLW